MWVGNSKENCGTGVIFTEVEKACSFEIPKSSEIHSYVDKIEYVFPESGIPYAKIYKDGKLKSDETSTSIKEIANEKAYCTTLSTGQEVCLDDSYPDANPMPNQAFYWYTGMETATNPYNWDNVSNLNYSCNID